jgi:hypothetical protein
VGLIPQVAPEKQQAYIEKLEAEAEQILVLVKGLKRAAAQVAEPVAEPVEKSARAEPGPAQKPAEPAVEQAARADTKEEEDLPVQVVARAIVARLDEPEQEELSQELGRAACGDGETAVAKKLWGTWKRLDLAAAGVDRKAFEELVASLCYPPRRDRGSCCGANPRGGSKSWTV